MWNPQQLKRQKHQKIYSLFLLLFIDNNIWDFEPYAGCFIRNKIPFPFL